MAKERKKTVHIVFDGPSGDIEGVYLDYKAMIKHEGEVLEQLKFYKTPHNEIKRDSYYIEEEVKE